MDKTFVPHIKNCQVRVILYKREKTRQRKCFSSAVMAS